MEELEIGLHDFKLDFRCKISVYYPNNVIGIFVEHSVSE